MIYLSDFKKIKEGKYSAGTIHFMPFDKVNGLGKTEAQLKATGMLIPEPNKLSPKQGYVPVLYCDPETNTAWYQYENAVPLGLTDEELAKQKIANLEKEVADLWYEIMMGGM